MTTFFNLITHLLIITGFLMIINYTYKIISAKAEKNSTEGLILVGTVVFAIFLYFSSLAFNLSIPKLLFDGLEQSDAFTFKVAIGTLISSAIGFLVSWYLTKRLEKNETFGTRIIILFLTLMIVLFGDVYIASYKVNIEGFNKALLPNVSFVIGILGYIIFNYKSEDK